MNNDREELLKIALAGAIGEFSANRAAILELAFANGGQEVVQKLESEYDVLRDAYFEILKRQLDRNNHLYGQLIKAANEEVENLKTSIKQVNNINDIIQLTSTVINLVGRILIVLGI